MKYSAVIFDLDGTLLDTLTDLANCYNRVLSAQGFPVHPEESYKQFVGDGARKCMQRALPVHARTEEIISSCVSEQAKDYLDNWHTDTRIYAGISDLLISLAKENIQLAVLSNKNHQFTQLCVDHFFPETRFNVIQGLTDNLAPKPDPTGALSVARQLGIDCAEIAFLGDSAMDIETANQAGMLSVGASWGFRSIQELKQAGAAYMIKAPMELMSIVLSLPVSTP